MTAHAVSAPVRPRMQLRERVRVPVVAPLPMCVRCGRSLPGVVLEQRAVKHRCACGWSRKVAS